MTDKNQNTPEPLDYKHVVAWVNGLLARRKYDQAEISLIDFQNGKQIPTAPIWGLISKLNRLQGNFYKAVEAAKQQIRLDPNAAEGYKLLAQAELFQNNYLAAREAAQQATSVESQNTSSYAVLAHAEIALGHHAAAKEAALQVVVLNNKSDAQDHQKAVGYSLLAQAEKGLGNYREAKKRAQQVIGLRPRSQIGYCLLSQAEAGLGDYTAAKRAAKQAIGNIENAHHLGDKQKIAGYNSLGRAELGLGNYLGVKAAAKQIIEIDPHHPIGYKLLARAQLMQGELEAAKETITILKKYDYHNRFAVNLEISVLVKENKLANAILCIQGALEEELVYPHLKLAKIMTENGLFPTKQYLQYYQRAVTNGIISEASHFKLHLEAQGIKKPDIEMFLKNASSLTMPLQQENEHFHIQLSSLHKNEEANTPDKDASRK